MKMCQSSIYRQCLQECKYLVYLQQDIHIYLRHYKKDKKINYSINLNAKDVGLLGRENNDCRVRYKLSGVVSLGETFNPEENEARSPTTKPTSNATICVNMRDRASKTRKLQPGYGCVAHCYWDPFFSATLSTSFFFTSLCKTSTGCRNIRTHTSIYSEWL